MITRISLDICNDTMTSLTVCDNGPFITSQLC